MNALLDIKNTLLPQALSLLNTYHWSIIPIDIDKTPFVDWKLFQTQLPTPEQLTEWFTKYPRANIGIVTGKISNLVVIDIDPRHGGKDDDFKEINTVIVKTGGGGLHYYFQYEDGILSHNGIKPGIDIKAEGGYVIVPPSLHPSGNLYKWEKSPHDGNIVVPLPNFVKDWVKATQQPGENSWDESVLNGVIEGERNNSAASVAGKLLLRFPKNEWQTVVWPLFVGWNDRNKPPLEEKELRNVFNSIAKKEAQKSFNAKQETIQIDLKIPKPVTLTEVLDSVEMVLPGKKDLILLTLAVSISHLIDKKTPVWLMFVGVPSSAKTEIVRLLSQNPNIFFLDTLTENAFVCGVNNKNGSNPSDLLPLLNDKCFIIKDFTTTLSQREETVRKILGDMTAIYDGTFAKHSPGRGTIRYQSFFSTLGCVTPQALNKHQRYINQIGPRFLFYRVPISNDEEINKGFSVLWTPEGTINALEEAGTLVSAYSYQLSQKIKDINLKTEGRTIIDYLNSLAKFIAHARGIVITRQAEFTNKDGETVSFYEPIEIQIEEPFRALLQLKALTRSLAIINEKDAVTDEELLLTRRIALSSMPADRSLLISVLATEDKAWSAKDVADSLGISHRTALRQLDELVSLKILNKSDQGGGLANLFSVNQEFHSILYASAEFMSNLSPTKT